MNSLTQEPGSTGTERFWRMHALLPAIFFALAAATIYLTDLDRLVANTWFFDAGTRVWMGENTWWAEGLIHGAGSALVRVVGLAGLVVLIGGYRFERLRPWRRKAAYLVIAIALCATVVSVLKFATNMDCPRDIVGFGGANPYVQLFEDRPDALPRAACFPGSHASTGFSLMAFYFLLMDTRPRLARVLLAAAVALGAVFSCGQQARGAHFLSHDLTSAALDWLLLLSLWWLLLRSPAVGESRLTPAGGTIERIDAHAVRSSINDRRTATDPAHARGRRASLRSVLQRLFRAGLPFRASAAQRGRGRDPGSRPVDAGQGHAPHRRLPGRVGALHVDLPDLSPGSSGLHPVEPSSHEKRRADR
jgi:membrane-associated PAP2 superfamily phosphatase